MAGYGGGYNGPSRDFRPAEPALRLAFSSALNARGNYGGSLGRGGSSGVRAHGGASGGDGGDPDEALAAQLARQPNIVGPGQERLDPDAPPEEWQAYATQPHSFMVGGEPYQVDPRIGLGLEMARQSILRGGQVQTQVDQNQVKQQEMEARVQRLVAAGYGEKEAVRQVFGGPRTVAEEQEIINTRSADQVAKDKLIQADISQRADAAAQARAGLQTMLERSRSGDRAATRQLQAQKILLDQATKAHAAAVKAQQMNAIGMDLGGSDPGDAALNAAVDEHLNDVQSSQAAQDAAIAGVTTAGKTGAPGAAGVPDSDLTAFLGVRQPAALNDASAGSVTVDPMARYHRAFNRGTLPGQTGPGAGLPTRGKALAPDQHAAASSDTAYKAWLQNKGYDVSTVPHPDDDQGGGGEDDSFGQGQQFDDGQV